MNKLFLLTLLSLMTLGSVLGQKNNKKAERIEAKKIAFITNTLDLSPQEAQVFWPIYNEHTTKLKAIKEEYNNQGNIETMSDKEVDQLIDNHLISETLKLDETKRYTQELRSILSSRKIVLLYKAERKFRRKVLKEVEKRMHKRKRKEKLKN